MPCRALDWRDLFVLVMRAQPDTATFKAFRPDWQHTPEIEMLRGIEHHTRWLVWAKTKDGSAGRNIPTPWPLPWDPKPDKGEFEADVMSIEELNKIIGW